MSTFSKENTNEIFEDIKRNLSRGVKDRKHDFHTPVFSNINNQNSIESRVVVLRDFDVENATETMKKAYKEKSKNTLIFTTPTVGNSSRNVDFQKHREIGAQMVGMCFQNYIKDRPSSLSQITQYHDYFQENGFYARKNHEDSFTYKIKADPTPTSESNLNNPRSVSST